MKATSVALSILFVLCLFGFSQAGPRVKADGVFPYRNVDVVVPLYDEDFTEKCKTSIQPESGERCIKEADVEAVYTPSSDTYDPSTYSQELCTEGQLTQATCTEKAITPAIANGVNSTLATCTEKAVQTINCSSRIKDHGNYYFTCDAGAFFVYDSDDRICTKMTSGSFAGKWKCDCDDWTTAKALVLGGVTLVQGTCTEKAITPAVANGVNFTPASLAGFTYNPSTYQASSHQYVASTYSAGSCGQVVEADLTASIDCPEIDDPSVPTRIVPTEQLVEKACVGDTINIRGYGFVYPQVPNALGLMPPKQIVKSRFAIFFQLPGKSASKKILSEDRELADINDGSFREERTVTFEKAGTYTIRYWVYNRGVVAGLARSRIIEVVEGCIQE